jgi:hypothetical protein
MTVAGTTTLPSTQCTGRNQVAHSFSELLCPLRPSWSSYPRTEVLVQLQHDQRGAAPAFAPMHARRPHLPARACAGHPKRPEP